MWCKTNIVFIGFFFLFSLTTTFGISPALILTPLIEKKLFEQARNLSLVDPNLFLNKTSYSGFLTVNEKYNSNLFFWYIQAENYRPDTPWILWLQGGPGSTSLAGLFDEIGPFEYSEGKLKLRKSTWAKDHSMLFIDNPVGAGYSFTDSPDGFVQDMETCSSHLYIALRQFLQIFPELSKAPLFIAGESYAGRYLPALGVKILEQDRRIGALDVNLQGIILGNPVMSRDSIADYSSIYYHWGLVDSQGLIAVKPLQDAYNKAIMKGDSKTASLLREELLSRLDDISMQQQTFNILLDRLNNLESFVDYLRRSDVSDALHVGTIAFTFHNNTAHTKLLTADFLSEVRSKIEMLLNHYRVLIYCGQMDLTAPCVPNAKARRQHWRWNHRDQFLNASRTPWWFDGRVAGYVKSGGGFTEVLVRSAGHLVPMDKPAETLELISYFIKSLTLPLPPDYHIIAQDTAKYIDDEEGIPKTILLPAAYSSSGTQAAMVISVVLNVLLILAIVCGIVYGLKWKKRTDAYLYNTVEENSISSTMF